MDNFLVHGCEQILRFAQVNTWDDLSQERKLQLGFNMGIVAHGLNLSKENGFQYFSDLSKGIITTEKFREHIESLIRLHEIKVNKDNISRPF